VAISFLPFELQLGTSFHPSRGIGLQHLCGLRDTEHRSKFEQRMRMVLDSSDRDYRHSMISCDSSHVGPQLRLKLLGDDFCAFFGAEDDVNVVADVRTGHSVPSLTGLDCNA
jgi:hypothetical protein